MELQMGLEHKRLTKIQGKSWVRAGDAGGQAGAEHREGPEELIPFAQGEPLQTHKKREF